MKKKTLIHRDSNQANLILNAWEQQKEAVQAVIDLYNAMGLPDLAPGELARLLNDTSAFLFDKLTGGQAASLAIGSGTKKTYLPLNKEHAISIMQKPDGYDALLATIKHLAEKTMKGVSYEAGKQVAAYNTAQIDAFFVIDTDGALQYSARVQAQIDEVGNYYINSEAGHKILSFVQDTVKAWYDNDMPGVQNNYRTNLRDLLGEVIESLDDKNKSFVCRAAEFVQLDRRLLNGEQ